MNTSSSEHVQRKKRQRIVESCQNCRARKSRCDGGRPCSRCAEKNLTCEYNEALCTVPQTLLDNIVARLDALERSNASNVAGRPQATKTVSLPQSSMDDCLPAFPNSEVSRHISNISNKGQAISPDSECAGGSKNGEFAANDTASSPTTHVPAGDGEDLLVESYKTLAYPVFPILDIGAFEKQHHGLEASSSTLLDNPSTADAVFLATTDMVYALGRITYHGERQDQFPKADAFYQHARTLIPLDACDVPSIAMIRYLLLTVHYLTYTSSAHRAHLVLAVAVKIAQTLELDKKSGHSSTNQRHNEDARRIWHLCMVFERLLASIYSATTFTKPRYPVPLPQPDDRDGNWTPNASTHHIDRSPHIACFLETIRLFQIIEDLQTVEQRCGERSSSLAMLETLDLHERTVEIERRLPPTLRCDLDSPSSSNPLSGLSARIIIIRIYHVRLLLLRRHIFDVAQERLLNSVSTTSLSHPVDDLVIETSVRLKTSTLCVAAARLAILHLYADLSAGARLSSVAVYIALTATTVIAASSAIEELGVSIVDGLYADIVSKAFRVLATHDRYVQGTTNASEHLRKYVHTIKTASANKGNQALGKTIISDEIAPEIASQQLGYQPWEFDFEDPLWDMVLANETFDTLPAT